MTSWQLIFRSLRYYGRSNAAVAMGVAAATAVLAGALIVGDSVRGTLRALTLDRLGKIEQVLVADRFFRAELAEELSQTEEFSSHFSAAAPAIYFEQGSLEYAVGKRTKRAAGVTVIGSDVAFWELGDEAIRPPALPGKDEIILNQPLADDLGISRESMKGAALVLRLPSADQVPAETPLGKKKDLQRKWVDLKVIEIIPARSLGRFSLRPSQETPRCAFVSRATLQTGLKLDGERANALLLAGRSAASGNPSDDAWLTDHFSPKLADYGLTVKRVRVEYHPSPQTTETAIEHFTISSDRMIFDNRTATAIESALSAEHPQPALAYLANEIKLVNADSATKRTSVPYSIVCAIDSVSALGPLVDEQGQPLTELADDEIVLTSWVGNDLHAQPGQTISLAYFEPESIHGQNTEHTKPFRIKAIVPLVEPAQPARGKKPALYVKRPAPTNDPFLTPDVPGITDADSVRGWTETFPFVDSSRFRPQDDLFWENHRTTPKAYVSLAAGRALWRSRFGETTLFRVAPRVGLTETQLEANINGQLRRDHVPLGTGFLPVKRQGLAASAGATPFDLLFLGLSLFILVAALVLVSLLFRLGFESRAAPTGLLLALGLSRKRVGWLLLSEGLLVATLGGLIGVPAGVGYAAIMIAGLNSWWNGAVASSSLTLYVSPTSLVFGFLGGLVMAIATILLCVRGLRRVSERRLLAGSAQESAAWLPHKHRWPAILAGVLAAGAVALMVLAFPWGGDAQAGAFVGGGMLLLVAILLVNWQFLRGSWHSSATAKAMNNPLAVLGLAWRNAGRNPLRSTLTVGLVATATFLIVALGAFRLDPTSGGSGGFALYATSDRPVFVDWNDPAARDSLLAERADAVKGTQIFSLRMIAGDDASCRNLYQPGRPRMLGVTPELASFYDQDGVTKFEWSDSAAKTAEERANPWRLLTSADPVAAGAPVPVVLDQATALYGLHLYGGVGEVFQVPGDGESEIRLRVVGLLSNSVLQGSLLVGERDFVQLFPRTAGYRFFLIQPPAKADVENVSEALEDALSNEGLAVHSTKARLADLLAVQNTYLSTFQSLGALGLLLGTFGLAAVQLRSVSERRGELALLQAVGLPRRLLAGLVLAEHSWLLLLGLADGCIAALLAILPQILLGAAHARPIEQLAQLLVVLVVGLLAGAFAVRAALRAPLIAALRSN